MFCRRFNYMKNIKDILSKRKYDGVPCPKCNGYGYFQLEDRIVWYRCTECQFETRANNYRDLRKEYHEKHKDDLEVVEVKC